ncbi:protein argonaute-4-like [Amblyomma americanum]
MRVCILVCAVLSLSPITSQELGRTVPSHFPRRPAHGQLGRPIQLIANHFSIEIPTGSVYHYVVGIFSETAKETKVPEQKVLIHQHEDQQDSHRAPMDLEEDHRIQKIIIKIQYAVTVNLDALHGVFQNRVNNVPQEVIQAIDIVLRFFSDSRCVRTPADRSLHDNQYVRLNRELEGLRVKLKHLPYPRKYKVVKITREAAKDVCFESEGSQTSVADYFQSRYRRLSYPNLPCVQGGSPSHPVYIPLDVCELAVGQHCRKKLDENQTTEMIKRTAKSPAKRFQEIRQSVRDLVSSMDEYLREFGVKINTEPTQVMGRMLDPPSLDFENNTMCKPRYGTWELRGQRFYKAMSMTQWIVHNVSAIRLACSEMSPTETYEPPLTFIVVQKRHHTRFMPANDSDGVGKFRNVPPGTTHIASKLETCGVVSESSGGCGDAVLTTAEYVEAVKMLQELQASMYFV